MQLETFHKYDPDTKPKHKLYKREIMNHDYMQQISKPG